jgi:hypothetical protein
MTIALIIVCKELLAPNWTLKYPEITLTPFHDGACNIVSHIDCPEWDSLLDFLEEEQRELRSFGFSLVDFPTNRNMRDERDWTNPDESWIGATPTWDDCVAVSPANTFEPACPSPCYGFVPIHLPLHVLQRPKDHVVGVGSEETIFSEAVCRFLNSLAPCDFGDVVLKGKLLRSHRRLLPRQSRKVIASEGLETLTCQVCYSPVLEGLEPGFYLGRRVPDLIYCRDEQGVGHLGAEHPYVFSVAVAQKLNKCFRQGFGNGYGLVPILDIDSPQGQRVFHLFSRLQKLKTSIGFADNDLS